MKLMVIDGNSILNRAYYGIRPLTTRDGLYTHAIFGFLTTLLRLEGEEYKRPKGDPGPLLSPWYNRRQISLCRDCNCEGAFFGPELAHQVLEGWRSLVPLYRWMRELSGDPPPDQM